MLNEYKKFRTLQGRTRKDAMRAELSKLPHEIDFGKSVYELSASQRCALSDMAKAVGYRKPVTSMHTLGGAFFCYLERDVARPALAAKSGAGKRWNNDQIARG